MNQATTTEHLMTHRPANKYCKICRAAKAKHRRHQRHMVPRWAGLKQFGDICTFDHIDCKAVGSQSKHGHKFGVIGLDLHTGFLMNRPLISKSGVETSHELRMWRG